MNFDFSEEQKSFGAAVRRALEKKASLAENRKVFLSGAGISTAAWEILAELGALGAAIPEAFGGTGLGPLETCVAAYEIGYSMAPTPYVSTVALFGEAIKRWGSDQQKSAWLGEIASGRRIGAAALGENGKPITEKSISVVIRDGKLYGTKSPVLDGAIADVAVVLALEAGKPVLAIVKLDRGVEREPLASLDPARPSALLRFDGTPCETFSNTNMASVRALVDFAAIVLAFEQVGAADRALAMARDYALQRKAFGQVIGAYQGIKHKLANIYIKNELARAHAYWGAWAITDEATETPLAAASARVAATDALNFAAQENIQTHGGIGFTWESDCQMFYRRARAYAAALGPVHRWKEEIVDQLKTRNAA